MKSHMKKKIAAGFTLIEVLIGILVLALGLLGLAAVFPLVVREQRLAQDAILGLSASRSAEAAIRSNMALNDGRRLGGWYSLGRLLQVEYSAGRLRNDWRATLGGGGVSGLEIYAGSWQGVDASEGVLVMPARAVTSGPPIRSVGIVPSDRMIPLPSPDSDPQFVWDVAVMLANRPGQISAASTNTPFNINPLRVAVFVRRIDPGIVSRLTADQTLGELFDGDAGSIRPVGANSGVPTLNGEGSYSTPQWANMVAPAWPAAQTTRPLRPGAVVIQAGGPDTTDISHLAQVGQKFVDVFGTVYTVTAVPDGADYQPSSNPNTQRVVAITPPLSPFMADAIEGKSSAVTGAEAGSGSFKVIVYVPQIPAAVDVLQIRP